MIKCNIKRRGTIMVSAKGTVDEIIPETLLIIQQLYLFIKKQNPAAAEQFRRAIIGTMLDPNSPMWKED